MLGWTRAPLARPVAHSPNARAMAGIREGLAGWLPGWLALGIAWAVVAASPASAQGDVFGNNRAQSSAPPAATPEPVPPAAELPLLSAEDARSDYRREVRIRGESSIVRLDRPDGVARHRPLSEMPVVICAAPPCYVLLPPGVTLGVQRQGERDARGGLHLPPGAGTLDITWKSPQTARRIGGTIMGALVGAGAGLMIGFRNDDLVGPVFIGMGTVMVLAGLTVGLILMIRRYRAVAHWTPGVTWR